MTAFNAAAVVGLVLAKSQFTNYCKVPDGLGGFDLRALAAAGPFIGTDTQSPPGTIKFHPCQGPDTTHGACTASQPVSIQYDNLAFQKGTFGCSVLSDWDPTGDHPPQWSMAPNGVDLQLTVQNGDTCQMTGKLRTITVNFICDPSVIAPASFVVTESSTCNYAWDFPTSAVCAPPAPTPPPAPTQRCVTTPGFDYSGVGHTIANVGDPDACCDVCFLTKGCNAWSVRKPKGYSFSCTLYNETHAVPASPKTVASGTITGAPTHYQDPFTHACLPDELNLTVANIKGHWCAAACSNSTPCPLDTPAGVTATPSCEIHDPIGSGKHCALKCMSSADCGPTSPPPGMNTSGASVTCDMTFTPGVCTYLA